MRSPSLRFLTVRSAFYHSHLRICQTFEFCEQLIRGKRGFLFGGFEGRGGGSSCKTKHVPEIIEKKESDLCNFELCMCVCVSCMSGYSKCKKKIKKNREQAKGDACRSTAIRLPSL